MNPLVTVICLCYNHERFVNAALNSVLSQTYSPIEIIVIDDASIDKSQDIIRDFGKLQPQVQMIFNETNKGSCSSFNKALKLAKGKYIIDFAADDLMLASKIDRQVKAFEKLDDDYGVVFSNVLNVNEDSFPIKEHFKAQDSIPEGFIYTEVLKRFFIPTITMMVKKSVLDDLGGYDEKLSYEDFDFWVRSSRKFKYHYIDEVLMHRRMVKGSLSANFLRKGHHKMLESSFRVCEKALWLNKNKEEEEALVQRLNIEMRLCFLMENFLLVEKYYKILNNLGAPSVHAFLLNQLSKRNVRVHDFYRWYLQIKK